MSTQTVAEIYEANDRIREKFIQTLAGLNETQISALPDGEKWTVAQIVEHVSLVEDGMSRICNKLLSHAKAEGQLSDGIVKVSEAFGAKSVEIAAVKLEAPERVHPSQGRSIAESLAAMEESRGKLNELRPLFEEYDCNTGKFPHPFLGDLSAGEWLILLGGHKGRHLKQIRNLVEKIG